MEDLKNIADLITSIDPGRNPLGTFADYVEILALSFANIPPKNGLNDRYKAVMGKYTAKQQKIFPEVTGRIIMYLTQKGVIHDVFGNLYMQISAGNSNLGQFFTPGHISGLMAALAISQKDCVDAMEHHGYIEIIEPSCGGGSTVLAACQRIREFGHNPQTQVLVKAEDLDISCVHMTFAQLGLWGIPAIVKHGNTLTGEIFDTYVTPFICNLRKRGSSNDR